MPSHDQRPERACISSAKFEVKSSQPEILSARESSAGTDPLAALVVPSIDPSINPIASQERTADDSKSNRDEISKLPVFLSTVLKSNTTYSSIANVLWSLTTSVPEAAIAHTLLGVRSIWNEFKAKLRNDFAQTESQTSTGGSAFFSSLLNSAGLSRTTQAAIFAFSSALSAVRGNLVDTVCFLGCAFAVSAVAHQMNVKSGTQLKLPELIEKFQAKIWKHVPNFFKEIAKDPAPGWLISDALIGVRNVSGVFTSQCSPILNTFAGIGLAVVPIGLCLAALKASGRIKLPPEFVVNLTAAQHISFAMANFMAGNTLLGTCAVLWATAGLLVGMTMKANQKAAQLSA